MPKNIGNVTLPVYGVPPETEFLVTVRLTRIFHVRVAVGLWLIRLGVRVMGGTPRIAEEENPCS